MNPRAITKFTICERHTGWFAGESRYRTAEVFGEGGPGYGEPCTGDRCAIDPGTDLFWEGICHEHYDTLTGPFAWSINRKVEA